MFGSAKRDDILSALRRGTVPGSGLEAFAVGVEAFAPVVDEELQRVALGRGAFKAVRGEYGTGKTFFGRWVQERARARSFAASEVQINETETPLYRLETVYRRLVERLGAADMASGAFRSVIDGWFFALEQDVRAEGGTEADDADSLLARTNALMFVSHASLSASERKQAEAAFAEERDCAIVATSTLELGIDVGDLDHVIQIDAPATVSSFL